MIVLPPSETKAPGGSGAPLDVATLSFPGLSPVRRELIAELSSLDVDTALEVLGISERLRGEAEANRALAEAPTMPAIERYTGVLFDALDAPSLPDAARTRLAVGSALFGLVRADDLIPHYRLSAGNKLGGRTLKSRWGTAITAELEALDGLVVDLRSGAYQQLGRFRDAVTVRVETPEGKVVSHFNKHYKGELARVLAECPDEPDEAAGVVRVARAAGLDARVDEAPPKSAPNQVILTVER